jgi:nucleoside-diphosphate-sugar epimerase
MHLVIFGCGYSGTAIAKAFLADGFRVSGTTRSRGKGTALRAQGIEAFVFDGETSRSGTCDAIRSATHLVQSIAPRDAGDPVLKLTGERISESDAAADLDRLSLDRRRLWRPQRQLGRRGRRLCSGLGPFEGAAGGGGGVDGDWCAPWHSRRRAAAIRHLWSRAQCVLNLARGTARRLIKKDQVFNRIRVEDIGASTRFLAERKLGGIYNVTDDRPGPPQDVIVEAARLMGVEPPPEQAFETAELTPMARSFYGENKRVSNAKLKASGFVFSFPSYPMSLAQLLQGERWRG